MEITAVTPPPSAEVPAKDKLRSGDSFPMMKPAIIIIKIGTILMTMEKF